MKHTEETKKKISETLKRKGIAPTVRPTREVAIKNLGKFAQKGAKPWNTGKRCPQFDGNTRGFKKGQKPHNAGTARPKPICLDCPKNPVSIYAKRCQECSYKHRRGENVYNWKGGIGQPFRKTGAYNKWRKAVYKRDNYTCQECFFVSYEKSKELDAHHIIPHRLNPDLIFEVNNGITLCKDCHNKTRNKEELFVEQYQKIVFSTTPPQGLYLIIEARLP